MLKAQTKSTWEKRGDLMRSARKSKGLMQKDVAEILGVKNNTIAGYEAGTRKVDIDTAVTICLFLGIDLALFLGLNRNFKFVKVDNENKQISEMEA